MPLERVSKGFKDISLSFKKNPLTDDIFPVKNETAIARSVRNIVYTQFGEKFLDYDFGTDVTASLFENIDTFSANILKDKIENSIINYEPRVKLVEVDVGSDYDNGEFNVSITYEIIGIDINSQIQQLEFVLQPTR